MMKSEIRKNKPIGAKNAMKLTGKLKKQVEQTTSREEARSLIEQAGMKLTDDAPEMVTGGAGNFHLIHAKLRASFPPPRRRWRGVRCFEIASLRSA